MNKNEFDGIYNIDVQKILLSHLIDDPDVFVRCRSILKDEYFDDQLQPAVRFIMDHADKWKTISNPELIKAKTRVEIKRLSEFGETMNADWFMSEFERFCRHRALENIMLQSYDLIQKGQYSNIEVRVKEAMTISLVSDLGTIYFNDPKERLKRMLDRSAKISTGWQTLDDKLYGGFEKGGLNIFSGGSGSGKSIFLQNLALNWAMAGYAVVYFTLELGSDLVANRIDAMITGKSTQEIAHSIDDSSFMIKMRSKNAGPLVIKKMPEGGTCANDFRAYLKEFQIKMGIKADCVVVDYLDLMYPNNQKMDMSNLFVKDKYVAEELRGMMHETDTFGASASQLNRGSIEVQGDFDHSHIAGGISKINTADNVFAIYITSVMRERGEYELIFLKTRSSTSVGRKIKLKYNQGSMRISDLDLNDAVEKPLSREELKQRTRESVKKDSTQQVANLMVKPDGDLTTLAKRLRRSAEHGLV